VVSWNWGEGMVLSSRLGGCLDFCTAWRSVMVWNIDEVMQSMCNDSFQFPEYSVPSSCRNGGCNDECTSPLRSTGLM
jgi:hypothetical protein